jgi:hypothetical protein
MRCYVGQVDIDFIDAAVFDVRRDGGHGVLEQARHLAVGVEIDRQQDGVRRQLGRLHHAHGRAHAQRARLVGGGGDDAAPDIVAQARKRVAAVRPRHRLGVAPAADDHRQAAQLGIAQQLDGRIKRVHVEVGNAALVVNHGASGLL